MPHVSVYSMSTIPEDCRLYVRPPWHAAFKAYEEFALGQGSEPTRVRACEHVHIRDVPFIKLTMQHMHEPTALALGADDAGGVLVEVTDGEHNEWKWANASGKQLQDRYMLHGTDITGFAAIFKSRRLKAGASSPIGVYGVLSSSEGEELAVPRAYVAGVIVGFEMHGCPVKISQYRFADDVIPESCMGYLSRKAWTDTGEPVAQWAGHEAGCVVRHMYVKQVLLQQFLDEQLDRCGYSKDYNEAIQWCDGKLRVEVENRLAR